MSLVEQRRSVGIAEVELVVEVHPIEHHALGERVRKLHGNALRHAVLQLHEEGVVMVLPGADQFVDLVEVGVDAAFRQQAIVHVRQGDRLPTAGRRSCARRTDDVSRRALQWIQVQVIGAAGKQMHAVVPHGADTYSCVAENLSLNLQTRLQY